MIGLIQKVGAMYRQSKRGTVTWLLIVGFALVLTLLMGDIPPAAGMALLAAYLGIVAATWNLLPLRWVRGLLQRDEPGNRPTEVALEAMARTYGLPNREKAIHLLDIGLIVDEQRPDGMSLRRGRFVSLDDDGVRPFALVAVPDMLGDRVALVRFELRDGNGALQYAFEEEKWLQVGENILVPDYRFPIRKRANELQAGGWSAHVMIDGGALGIHHFNVADSLAMRQAMVGPDGELLRDRVWRTPEDDESLPLSLEELLRQQSRQYRES